MSVCVPMSMVCMLLQMCENMCVWSWMPVSISVHVCVCVQECLWARCVCTWASISMSKCVCPCLCAHRYPKTWCVSTWVSVSTSVFVCICVCVRVRVDASNFVKWVYVCVYHCLVVPLSYLERECQLEAAVLQASHWKWRARGWLLND